MRSSEENLAVARHAQGVLVDGRQRESVLHAVVPEPPRFLVEDGEALVGDEQQLAAHGRFLRVVDAVADKSVRGFVEVLEVLRGRAVEVEAAARGGEPEVALAVLHDVVHVVVAEAVRLFGVMPVVGQLACVEAVGEYALTRGGNP